MSAMPAAGGPFTTPEAKNLFARARLTGTINDAAIERRIAKRCKAAEGSGPTALQLPQARAQVLEKRLEQYEKLAPPITGSDSSGYTSSAEPAAQMAAVFGAQLRSVSCPAARETHASATALAGGGLLWGIPTQQ